MNFAGYRALLRIAPVRRLLLIAMVARIPHAAAGVLLTLHVVETLHMSYAAAGGVAAAITVGMAVGAPWRGRQVDIRGLRRALVPSVIAEVAVWSTAPFLNYELLLVAAVVGGLFAVPIFSVVRQSLGVMVPQHQRRTAYALDSMGAEITFMVGPAAGVMLATTTHTVVGLVIIGVSSALAGLLLMLANPPTRTGQKGACLEPAATGVDIAVDAPTALIAGDASRPVTGQPRTRFRRFWGAARGNLSWVNLAVLAVLGASLGAGLVLSGTDVGMVAVLRHNGQVGELGIVFFFWCGASLLGGLIYGSLRRSINPLWLLGAMALLTIPMGFATDAWTLGLLSILPGLLCAPVLTSSAEHIADLVEERRRGEAMGWYGSSMTIGSALGAPFAGVMIDAVGPWSGFVVIGALAGILAAAGLIAQGARRGRRGVSADGGNARPGALDRGEPAKAQIDELVDEPDAV
ncbi:MFS family permease [Arthrobacter silviterrae]|uniref:MFS transporter n=1 Tax=Arthrobacter silviterrae TaxID=2026658 RepID=A0ABX0D4R7_9MICC|nr:MFS transporter [Arthrobacter silviterrae]MDQ0279639.1 MFS family permease [Arthrobacter silviterrae]NGN81884.1 MFS transporter [Arthrobacter silviterrae]